MPLPQPKKGGGPPTGKTKLSRAEQLMQANRALANDQLPDEDTMSAIEGEPPSPSGEAATSAPPTPSSRATSSPETGQTGKGSPPVARGAAAGDTPIPSEQASERASSDAIPSDGEIVVRTVPVTAIRPSPFQPKGRPSVAAVERVREAIREAGSLASLVGPEGGSRFMRLTPEAARLSELAYDIKANGMKVPIEIRTTDEGDLECLSGHRRLAAAKLAGLAEVPVIDRGTLSNAAAAATVLRGNLHRENFTTWQEAVLVTEVQERRKADGYRDNVRTLGAVMGWSHGKVNTLLRIRRALSPSLLATLDEDEPERVEELLAQVQYRDLERLLAEEDEARRQAKVRQLLGMGGAPPASTSGPMTRACDARPKRNGGFRIESFLPVENLSNTDAQFLREELEKQLDRVNLRLRKLAGDASPAVGTSGRRRGSA